MLEPEVLQKLLAWAAARPEIAAMLMTSTRARPGAPVDALSDYDIILAVEDAAGFAHQATWTSDFGRPMVRWGDESELFGLSTYFRGVIYDNYVKIDYSIWPVALLDKISAAPALPDQLDVGYRVLLDKAGRTAGWPPPSYHAHIPARPSEAEYDALVQEFWWTATYAAKALWRGELIFAKFCLDYDLKLMSLRRMLEWRVEIDHDWTLKPGVYGRGLERLLPGDTWAELSATYAAAGFDENWNALFDTARLFRRVATEVGAALGYTYPQQVDDKVSEFLAAIHRSNI